MPSIFDRGDGVTKVIVEYVSTNSSKIVINKYKYFFSLYNIPNHSAV